MAHICCCCYFVRIFVPDKQAALLYVIFFGYYPILKALIERLKNKIVQWVLKYAVFNAAIVSAYFIAIYLLSIPADSLSLFEYHCRGYFGLQEMLYFLFTILQLPVWLHFILSNYIRYFVSGFKIKLM